MYVNKNLEETKMEIRVLFICLGNICRSPMAEAIFRDLVKKGGLQDRISCDSAGTGGWHKGNPPHQGTRNILKQNNIDDLGILARQVIKEDLESFDYIVAMDNSNISNLKALDKQLKTSKVRLLLDYTEEHSGKEVPDPYYTGNFDEVYQLVIDGCQGLLTEIKKTYHL